MPIEVGYFTLPVANLEKAQKFYGSLFGWEFHDGHIHNTAFPMGLHESVSGKCGNIYFKVGDIDGYLKSVAKLGGLVINQNDSQSGRNAVCVDDQGTEFSLWQPAPGFE